jgi:5-methylcytosine-specific restriction endonuclease McrA
MLDGLKFSAKRTQKKEPKRIPAISKKKQKRIRETGSEADLFREIWDARKHECEQCGRTLRTARAHNFDHTEPKSRGESRRLDPGNVKILCFACHFEKTSGQKYKGADYDL